jgi:hypothetical protein
MHIITTRIGITGITTTITTVIGIVDSTPLLNGGTLQTTGDLVTSRTISLLHLGSRSSGGIAAAAYPARSSAASSRRKCQKTMIRPMSANDEKDDYD